MLLYLIKSTFGFKAIRWDESLNNEKDCDLNEELLDLEHAVAVAQHHDAVTGTEKQYVAEDYHYRLDKSITGYLNCASQTLDGGIGEYYCALLNVSQCEILENKEMFTVFVYNPMARARKSIIRIPVTYTENSTDVTVIAQVS